MNNVRYVLTACECPFLCTISPFRQKHLGCLFVLYVYSVTNTCMLQYSYKQTNKKGCPYSFFYLFIFLQREAFEPVCIMLLRIKALQIFSCFEFYFAQLIYWITRKITDKHYSLDTFLYHLISEYLQIMNTCQQLFLKYFL